MHCPTAKAKTDTVTSTVPFTFKKLAMTDKKEAPTGSKPCCLEIFLNLTNLQNMN